MSSEDQVIFTENESAVLNQISNRRNKLIDKLEEKENALYDDNEMAKLFLSALKDEETQIFNKAKIRAKSEDNKNQSNTLDLIANIFLNTKANSEKQPNRETPISLGENFIVDDLVPGEMDEISFRVSPEDIM